jgi:hypothetical protein
MQLIPSWMEKQGGDAGARLRQVLHQADATFHVR